MEQEPVEVSESQLHSLLIDTGVKLLAPPPAVDEILAVLDSVEDLLGLLGQDPSCSLQDALLPAVKGLVSDKLFRHPDMDVKVSVLSCIHELIRITAPEAPYEGDRMKEIFQQTLIVFEKLSLFTGRCYIKALHILETLAKVRSCLILLDLGCDALIIQMFQLLLDTIHSNHPDAVFLNMEEIMTRLIEEIDEISLDLLKPLLTSVKKENQNISPLSWRLGMKVLKNCSTKVKPYLMKTIEKMRLDIEDYTDIVASIWPDVPAEDDVMKEAETDASDLVRILGDSAAQQRDNHEGTLVNGNSSKTFVHSEQIEPLQIIAEESVQHEAIESGEGLQIKASVEALPRRRWGKPNSMRKLDEGFKDFGVSGGKTSSEVPRKRKNYGTLGSLPKKLSLEKSPLLSKPVSLDQTSVGRGRPKKKESTKHVSVKKEEDFLSDSVMKDKTTAQDCDAEGSLLKSYKKSGGGKEYREELIGSRVKVWWPIDRRFYEGVVETYDPFKKKHKIVYVDGDTEILTLKKERWLLLDDVSTQRDQEAILPRSSVASVKMEKEEARLREEHNATQENSGLHPKKKDNTSSSKKRLHPRARQHGNESEANTTKGILDIKKELDTPEDDDDKALISEMLRYVHRSNKSNK